MFRIRHHGIRCATTAHVAALRNARWPNVPKKMRGYLGTPCMRPVGARSPPRLAVGTTCRSLATLRSSLNRFGPSFCGSLTHVEAVTILTELRRDDGMRAKSTDISNNLTLSPKTGGPAPAVRQEFSALSSQCHRVVPFPYRTLIDS
jgi:hypothetical protein